MSTRLTSNPVGLLKQHGSSIDGVISCFDRIIISGTLPDCCHPGAMTKQLIDRNLKIFAYAGFVKKVRDHIVDTVSLEVKKADMTIDFIRRADFSKEKAIATILEQRGMEPGLVHVFSAMERCSTMKPWRNPDTGHTALRWTSGKCLHYYIYFIDQLFGLCFLRIPTWAPFRLQFYCNGHNYLANQLRKNGITFETCDNSFVRISNYPKAQELADGFPVRVLHKRLDKLAAQFCPVHHEFKAAYHWSLSQVEYSTDIVFKESSTLAGIYPELTKNAIYAVHADNVATFLGRRGLSPLYNGEVGSRMQTRIEGTCIKHHMDSASIKMYDKFGIVLRIETTANDISFFKHHRTVYKRDGTSEQKLAGVRKSIHSLGVMRDLMSAANGRYLRFISELAECSPERRDLDKISSPVKDEHNRSHRGLNLFAHNDFHFILALLRGEHCISGFTNRLLQKKMSYLTPGQISRALKRLCAHGLIRRIPKTYKYYPTVLGQKLLIAALKLKENTVIPAMRLDTQYLSS